MSIHSAPIIAWFRGDLRLADNRALVAAAETQRALIACYVLDETRPNECEAGGASRWWLHHSLRSLAAELDARGGRLILRRGPVRSVVARLASETRAREVHASSGAEPEAEALERMLRADLEADGVALHLHPGGRPGDPDC